jgi:structural maintenance of chromosome 4
MEKINRLKIVEKEKANLEPAKVEAEEYLKTESEIISKKSIVYQINRAKVEVSVSDYAGQKEGLEKKLDQEKSNNRESADRLIDLEGDLKKTRKQCEQIEKDMNKAKSEFTAFERRDVKHQEDMKHYKAKVKKLTATIAGEKKFIKDKSETVNRLKSEIEKCESEIDQCSVSKEKEEKELDKIKVALREETKDFQVELEIKQKELIPFNKKVDDQQSLMDLCKSEVDILRAKSEQAQKKLEQAKSSLTEIQKGFPAKKSELQKKKQKLEDSKTRQTKQEKQLKVCQEEEKAAEAKLKVVRTKLEEAKVSIKESQTRNKMLSGLLDAKKKGKLAGLYGRLGDLGTIDGKYDVAITTACSALNNLVVDTTENAEACVQYLRKNELGVATFIILEKLAYLSKRIEDKFQTPEGAERLFDLVKPKDSSLRPAFYFALQDTLVADNLDRASTIAFGGEKQKYRVVTLDGSLIDISGTMSGGGNRALSGGMKSTQSSDFSPEEIEDMNTEVKKLSDSLMNSKGHRMDIEKELQELSASIDVLEVEIPKLENELKSMKLTEEQLNSQLEKLEEECHLSPEQQKQVKEKEGNLEKLEKEMEKIKKSSSKLEQEIKEIEKKILDAGGMKLKIQKSKVDSLNEQIENANNVMVKAAAQIKTAEKAIVKSQKEIETNEAELQEIEKTLEMTKAEFKKGEEEATKVMESYKAAETLLNEKIAETKKAQSEYDKLKKIVDKFRTTEVEIQNQIEDINRTLKEHEAKVQHWAKKIAELEKQKARNEEDNEEDKVDQLPILTEEQLEEYDAKKLGTEIAALEEALSSMKPNMTAIREYRKKEKEFESRMKEVEDATEKRDNIRKEYESLRKKRLDEFMTGFAEITLRLKEMYQMITLGGDAELELVDSLDPFSEGVIFSVRPPKKSWKNISNLSGGEKTLSSLALVFALHHYKPTPLYVMDEIDAALDFRNVSIVANYVKERTKNAQFVIISLRNYMFELADHLVGIYKTQDCSKSVTIAPSKFSIPKPTTNDKQPQKA